MARIARQDDSFDGKRSVEDLLEILLSATNPDGTPFTLPTEEGKPAAADVLVGHLAHTVTTAAATLITIPQGRTWVGELIIACDIGVAAASTANGQALGIVATAGAGATPAAGTVASCEARAGANAATGTVGSSGANSISVPLIVVAPAGNGVDLTLASTLVGTAGRVSATASGRLL